MDVLDARLCLMLHSIPRLGHRALARLFLHYGSAENIWQSRIEDWHSIGVAPEAISEAARLQAASAGAAIPPQLERQLEVLCRMGAEVLPLTDSRYPVLLHTVYDPPPILYVLGDCALLQQAQLGIVGSRKASPPGRRAALALAGEVVRAGLHVCSGLAAGIDEAAHRAALDAGGKTIAVMATGLDVIYPARHRGLADELVRSGCLVSEFPPGAKPLRQSFPQRNRVISGLSLGVLVVEAARRSGSLITARTAMEQGREVFTLPWSIFHPTGQGCLKLLREGAKMVQSVEDILEEIGPLYHCQREMGQPEQAAELPATVLTASQQAILGLVGSEVITVDELELDSGLPIGSVLAALTVLEVAGKIARFGGGYIHC